MERIPPPSRPLPPDHLFERTCGECWEPFTKSWLSRWLHRRKWGHEPYDISPAPTEAERHAELVARAKAFREREAK